MNGEQRIIDGYRLMHTVGIGGAEESVAESTDGGGANSYRIYSCSRNNPLGIEEYRVMYESGDYLQAMREFTRRINVCLDSLDLDRVYRGTPQEDFALYAKDCVPGGMDESIEGRIVAIKTSALAPEYRARSHQLVIATGGFGCSPNARGRAVYCKELYSGDEFRRNRQDILGVVEEETLPAWARERIKTFREPAGNGSVLGKIRKSKTAEKNTPQSPVQNKEQTEPEL
jgi:hypothetical protein